MSWSRLMLSCPRFGSIRDAGSARQAQDRARAKSRARDDGMATRRANSALAALVERGDDDTLSLAVRDLRVPRTSTNRHGASSRVGRASLTPRGSCPARLRMLPVRRVGIDVTLTELEKPWRPWPSA